MKSGLERGARMGRLAGDLALLKIRSRSGGAVMKEVRERIVDQLGLLHGLPQKIGQLLAFSDIEQSSREFSKLTESCGMLPHSVILERIEQELGGNWQDSFEWIEKKGVGASIGQVHRAQTKNGRQVALKVQYPGIAEALETDLQALGWLLSPVGGVRRGFDVGAFRNEIGSMIRDELDYLIEASRMATLRGLFASDCHRVRVPDVDWNRTTRHLITMDWMEGVDWTHVVGWDAERRRVVCQSMLEVFLRGLFEWDMIHSDPNPGNYRFECRDGMVNVVMLDFGSVKRVEKEFRTSLHRLLEGAVRGELKEAECFELFLGMGFHPTLTKKFRGILSEVARVLAAPFTNDGPWNVREWRLSEKLAEMLGENRMTFRMAGPPELIFILRSFQGLLHYLRTFNAPVVWRLPRLNKAEEKATINPFDGTRNRLEGLGETRNSNSLYIEVTRAGETVVKLELDPEVLESMETMLSPQLLEGIRERKIDFNEITRKAKANQYACGELYSSNDGEKSVRVWLE